MSKASGASRCTCAGGMAFRLQQARDSSSNHWQRPCWPRPCTLESWQLHAETAVMGSLSKRRGHGQDCFKRGSLCPMRPDSASNCLSAQTNARPKPDLNARRPYHEVA